MATKQVIISDISGKEIADGEHARVVVEHPDYNSALEIDVTKAEAEKFKSTDLKLATITVHATGQTAKTMQIETKALEKLFGANTSFDDILGGARKVARPATSAKGKQTPASKGERIDYTQPHTFGQLHRGRVTDAEKELVQKNKAQASKNREAQGHPPIDWNDPKEQERYGL